MYGMPQMHGAICGDAIKTKKNKEKQRKTKKNNKD